MLSNLEHRDSLPVDSELKDFSNMQKNSIVHKLLVLLVLVLWLLILLVLVLLVLVLLHLRGMKATRVAFKGTIVLIANGN